MLPRLLNDPILAGIVKKLHLPSGSIAQPLTRSSNTIEFFCQALRLISPIGMSESNFVASL